MGAIANTCKYCQTPVSASTFWAERELVIKWFCPGCQAMWFETFVAESVELIQGPTRLVNGQIKKGNP